MERGHPVRTDREARTIQSDKAAPDDGAFLFYPMLARNRLPVRANLRYLKRSSIFKIISPRSRRHLHAGHAAQNNSLAARDALGIDLRIEDCARVGNHR